MCQKNKNQYLNKNIKMILPSLTSKALQNPGLPLKLFSSPKKAQTRQTIPFGASGDGTPVVAINKEKSIHFLFALARYNPKTIRISI